MGAVALTDGQVGSMKAATAWGATGVSIWLERIGVTSWGDVAAMLAALYSLLLIIEWLWKKLKRIRDEPKPAE